MQHFLDTLEPHPSDDSVGGAQWGYDRGAPSVQFGTRDPQADCLVRPMPVIAAYAAAVWGVPVLALPARTYSLWYHLELPFNLPAAEHTWLRGTRGTTNHLQESGCHELCCPLIFLRAQEARLLWAAGPRRRWTKQRGSQARLLSCSSGCTQHEEGRVSLVIGTQKSQGL